MVQQDVSLSPLQTSLLKTRFLPGIVGVVIGPELIS